MNKKILYYWYLITLILNKKKLNSKIGSQNEKTESAFLIEFIKKVENKKFIEFGFHPLEFNTIHLMTSKYEGTLVDANKKNVILMKLFNFFHNYNIKSINLFLNKENITKVLKHNFGIFSIDVDGNDYWLTKEVLNHNTNFELMIVEYNSSFLDKSVTVPYDPLFNRHQKHKSGWYHGASLKAFINLFDKKDYALIKTIGGNNAFFTKRKFLNKFNFKEISFEEGFEECKLRNQWSNTSAKQQFDEIKKLEMINV